MAAFEPPSRSTVGSIQNAAAPDLSTRFLAALVDGVVISLLMLLVGWVPVIGSVIGPLYVLTRDGVEVGPIRYRSVGKAVTGLRPRRLDGGPMNLETSIRRNGLLGVAVLAPFLGILPLLGGALESLVVLVAGGALLVETYQLARRDDQRRWGDRWAGTRVVESGDALLYAPPRPRPVRSGRSVPKPGSGSAGPYAG
jgi:uncharacterized RDD family membrane protein YckC